MTYPACARFKFGDGRLGEVRSAADTPVGIAVGPGKFTVFGLEASVPTLLRKAALVLLADSCISFAILLPHGIQGRALSRN